MKIQRRYQTIVQRIAAAFVDSVVFLPLTIIFDRLADTNNTTAYISWSFISTSCWLAYSVYLHGRYGQTIGKMASQVRVFALDETHLITYKRAFLRELISTSITVLGWIYLVAAGAIDEPATVFGNFVFYPGLLSSVIEIITTLTNARRRSLHDLLAGSVVLDITVYRKWDFEYEEVDEHKQSDST